MRRELLKKDDWNVITVDWAGGSLPLYTQATANTRLVGLELAHFLNHLVSHFGLDPGHVHMIGHSLGAHTAGYAGERVPGIARITGAQITYYRDITFRTFYFNSLSLTKYNLSNNLKFCIQASILPSLISKECPTT